MAASCATGIAYDSQPRSAAFPLLFGCGLTRFFTPCQTWCDRWFEKRTPITRFAWRWRRRWFIAEAARVLRGGRLAEIKSTARHSSVSSQGETRCTNHETKWFVYTWYEVRNKETRLEDEEGRSLDALSIMPLLSSISFQSDYELIFMWFIQRPTYTKRVSGGEGYGGIKFIDVLSTFM